MDDGMLEPLASSAEDVGDPVARHNGRSSVGLVVFQYTNCVVGSGILALAYAFHQAGLVMGLAMMVLIVVLTDVTVRQLVATGVTEGVRNYEELMDKLFGSKGYVTISVLLFLYDFGAIISYLIILAEAATSVVTVVCIEVFGLDESKGLLRLDEEWTLRRLCLLVLSFCLILPLVVNRDIAVLAKISRFSVLSSIVMICIMTGAVIAGDTCPDRETDPASCPDTSQPWLTFIGSNPSKAFGIIAFGFVSHDTAFMLRNSLKDTTKWGRTTDLALLLSMAICLWIAIPGCIGFRDTIKDNILKNFAPDDYKIVAVRVLLIFSMVATYPMCFFIVRHVVNELYNLWQTKRGGSERIRGTPAGLSIHHVSTQRHLFITFVLFGTSVGIALVVKDLAKVMALTGNVSAVSIAFVLPPICTMQSKWNGLSLQACPHTVNTASSFRQTGEQRLLDDSFPSTLCPRCKRTFWLKNISNVLITVFGIFVMIFCTIQSFND